MSKRINECVFCKIIEENNYPWIVFQDEKVIAFFPLHPETNGHTILAPKEHYQDIYSVPDLLFASLFKAAKMISLQYKEQIGATGVNILHASGIAAQQSVLHFHLHLIPRFSNDGLNAWPKFPANNYDNNAMLKSIKITE